MELSAPHTPVMLQEVLEWLRIKPDGTYVDATLGAGGHSQAIAERISSGRLISLDRDAQALQIARERLKTFGSKVTKRSSLSTRTSSNAQALQIARERLKTFGSKVNYVLSPFSRIAEAVHELGIPKVD